MGDPNFNAANLSTDMRLWYDRLKTAMVNARNTIRPRAASANFYQIGRIVNEHVTALIAAFRATGSLEFLREAADIRELAAGTELNKMWVLRTVLGTMGVVEAMELLQEKIRETKSNEDFLRAMNQ